MLQSKRTESNYPKYRKFKNGKEFHKVVSESKAVSVLKLKTTYRIIVGNNSFHMESIMNDSVAMESNRDEFEKVFGEAMWELNKANTII